MSERTDRLRERWRRSLLVPRAPRLRICLYLLVSEVIRSYIDVRRGQGAPTREMDDTFWGATKGLAYFKERLGFKPHTVDWVWGERAWLGARRASPPSDGASQIREPRRAA